MFDFHFIGEYYCCCYVIVVSRDCLIVAILEVKKFACSKGERKFAVIN